MSPPSLCFLSGRESPLPRTSPSAARSGSAGVPWCSGPPTPAPQAGTSSQAPSPSAPPLTLRGLECRSLACARSRRGGAGPRPPGWASRSPWSHRLRGPGAGRRLRREWRCRCRRRGVLLCSCSSTERGRYTPELGKWEEGSEGGQRRRRRGDRRPRRLTLLAALACRRLTPPPAAGRADSEGERGARREDWAPRGSADGTLRRFCYRR